MRYLILLCVFGSLCYAGTIDPHTPDQKHIEYGTKFPYVGYLCGSYNNGESFCGSSVAIDDHNLLTAAHVVNNAQKCTVKIEKSVYKITKIIVHKDFQTDEYGVADIAICHTDSALGLKFYPALYTENNEPAKLASMSGYGFTGTFISGANRHDNKKRAGSNYIDKIEKDLLICSPSRRGRKGFTSLEFLIASGDSGGGLFIGNKLAGIHSCVMAIDRIPHSKYGEESGHTRISKFIEWINKNKK